MRMIWTGMKDGKSCVIREQDIVHEGEDVSVIELLDLELDDLPARPEGKGAYVDLPVPHGKARWYRIRFPANQGRRTHYTDTIDCHTIVAGEVDLILDDGPHRLTAGDSAIVTGVDHGWQSGPEGCTVSMIIFGTPKP